jgi:hypothetical protein
VCLPPCVQFRSQPECSLPRKAMNPNQVRILTLSEKWLRGADSGQRPVGKWGSKGGDEGKRLQTVNVSRRSCSWPPLSSLVEHVKVFQRRTVYGHDLYTCLYIQKWDSPKEGFENNISWCCPSFSQRPIPPSTIHHITTLTTLPHSQQKRTLSLNHTMRPTIN